MYNHIFVFKSSTSINNERGFSLKWYDEAKRLCEVTKCTTLKKLHKDWKAEDIQRYQEVNDGVGLRRMLNALNNGETDMATLIDITLGKGSYAEYEVRTKGARSAANTRMINQYLGFENKRCHWNNIYYHPYKTINLSTTDWRVKHRNLTYIEHSCEGAVEGGWNRGIIEKYRKQGVIIQKMLETRRANLAKNMEYAATKRRNERIQKAKLRLEKHIGMTGWRTSNYGYNNNGFRSFDYNGTVWEFGNWEHTQSLTWDEYKAFTQMTKEQQAQFVHDKRDWMLALLQEERRVHEENEAQRAEWEREAAEKARIREEQKAYIEKKKAEGDTGLLQLWHECLIDSDFHNRGASFFHGGNALLRVNEERQRVETSKGIYIMFDECKRLWAIVNRWHENGTTFTSSNEKVRATTNNWSISRFQDDIMIAGCHAIHYSEMYNVVRQLGLVAQK